MPVNNKILKILASHPVQYQVPLWRELLADGWEIKVGYYHQGTAGRLAKDTEFGVEMQWDIDLLSGYPYQVFVEGTASFHWTEQIKIAGQLFLWALRPSTPPLLLMGWFTELAWLLWLLRIITRTPVIVMSETTPLSFASTPKPRWRVTLLSWLLRHTTACLFIGSRNHAFFREMGVPEERLFYTPYSVDNTRFYENAKQLLSERISLCYQYGLNPEMPTFLFCGKLISKKHPLQILDAYVNAGLKNKAQLLYVGDGELRLELERRIQILDLTNVHLLGFLNQSQMPLAYVLGELLCLISDPTETWGLVVNEAFICGRPVIVSEAVGCSPDLVSSDVGWTIPLDNPAALTKALRSAYEQYPSWVVMGRKAQEKISSFTFTHMANGIRSALEIV